MIHLLFSRSENSRRPGSLLRNRVFAAACVAMVLCVTAPQQSLASCIQERHKEEEAAEQEDRNPQNYTESFLHFIPSCLP